MSNETMQARVNEFVVPASYEIGPAISTERPMVGLMFDGQEEGVLLSPETARKLAADLVRHAENIGEFRN